MRPRLQRLTASVALVFVPRVASADDINDIEAITVEEGRANTVIRVSGDLSPTYSVFMLDGPPRLFVDISNSQPSAALSGVAEG